MKTKSWLVAIVAGCLMLCAYAQSATASSPSEGFWQQTTNYQKYCVVSPTSYGPHGPQTWVFCSVGEAVGWYPGQIPSVLTLWRRDNGAPQRPVMTVGTISVSGCDWKVLFGTDPTVYTLRKVPCNSVFSKPNDR